jgi:hypothetical protein
MITEFSQYTDNNNLIGKVAVLKDRTDAVYWEGIKGINGCQPIFVDTGYQKGLSIQITDHHIHNVKTLFKGLLAYPKARDWPDRDILWNLDKFDIMKREDFDKYMQDKKKRIEELKLLHIQHDPYGEEIWENYNKLYEWRFLKKKKELGIDPYGEEDWGEEIDKDLKFYNVKYIVPRNWFNNPLEILKTNLHFTPKEIIENYEISSYDYVKDNFIGNVKVQSYLSRLELQEYFNKHSTIIEKFIVRVFF